MDLETTNRIAMVAFAAVLYLLSAGCAIRLIAGRKERSRKVRQMLLSAGMFAMLVIGSVALSETSGSKAAAWFSAVACTCALALFALVSHIWKRSEIAQKRMIDELRATVNALEGELSATATPEMLCAQAAKDFELTRREEEMLLLLSQGCSYADIAKALVLSPNTVKTHIRSLYKKIEAPERESLKSAIAKSRAESI